MDGNERIRFEEPGFARFLFASTSGRLGLAAPCALYLGLQVFIR